MDTPLTVVILAAGLGTRMKSKKAKVLHQAGGRALIGHVAGTALELTSPDRIFVVVGSQAEQVQAAVSAEGLGFIHQAEQKGTGHALMVCRERLAGLPGLLAVLYGDCPLLSTATLRELVERQRNSTAAATVITTVLEDPAGYGRVLRDESGRVRAIVEQKAAAPDELAVREINSGIYCFRADLLWKHIDEIRPDNPAREYYLTDIVEIFGRAGYGVEPFLLAEPAEVLGINTRAELAEVDRICRQRKVRELMLAGVTIEKPETVTIDAGARIGADTVVEPFAQILGRTAIGEDCRIGACSIVRDSELADRVEVRPFSIIEGSQVGAEARVGPYARLRPGSRLGAGAHVGNFVELKQTRLGAGSKANHLAYLGDAEIGDGVNVGAGTITCNYDGVEKHPTKIGNEVFVGSNATLVAPLELGDGCYVGAGSVVTDPVPPQALALGRARQVNKEGWARKRRPAARKNPPTEPRP
ncbi:MAG: bifunctional UDP-N-acetylglucosamine diphosphorylase/glucosamine-1-phosphate N-acetyltransferase GlmU [Acidobacteriota bacterium]